MDIKKSDQILDQIINLSSDEYGTPYSSLFEQLILLANEIKQKIKIEKSRKKPRLFTVDNITFISRGYRGVGLGSINSEGFETHITEFSNEEKVAINNELKRRGLKDFFIPPFHT